MIWSGKRRRKINGRRFFRAVLWALVAAGFAASFWSARGRWRIERENRRVEITLDYNELRSLAAAEGVPLANVLRQFKNAGVISVAVPEDTIGGLEDNKRLEARPVFGPDGRVDQIRFLSVGAGEADLQRVVQAIAAKTPYKPDRQQGGQEEGVFVPQTWAALRGLGVGLDPRTVAEVQKAGLGIVGRVGDWPGVRPPGIAWVLGELKRQGVSTVIFSGDEVVGHKGFVAADKREPTRGSTEEALRALGLFYGTVEFVKQKGDPLLVRAAPDRTVRVHTVGGAEMQAATIDNNVQRFLLAARERNIRLLFVRLFPDEPDALAENVRYVAKIAKGLPERGDLAAGPAHGFNELNASRPLRALMGLGLAAAFLLLVDSVSAVLAGGAGLVPALAAGGGVLLFGILPVLPGGTSGPKLAALAAACVFPALALVRYDWLRPAPPPCAALSTAFRRFFVISGTTLIGAAYVVGLLAERVFVLKSDAFVGIKGAQLVPVLLAALVYFLGLRASGARPWPRVVERVSQQIVRLGVQPILLWQVGAALAALIVLALLVLRSGNEGGVAVSGIEMRIRALLDRILYARPRFKEFLIGHPALFVALAFAARNARCRSVPRPALVALFLAGAIGQVSLLNTFCHLHTPLLVSLWRAGLGLGLGCLIGVLVYLVLTFVERRWLGR